MATLQQVFCRRENAISSRQQTEISESSRAVSPLVAAINTQDLRGQVSEEELANIWGISIT